MRLPAIALALAILPLTGTQLLAGRDSDDRVSPSTLAPLASAANEDTAWDSEDLVRFRRADGCEVERRWIDGEIEERVRCVQPVPSR